MKTTLIFLFTLIFMSSNSWSFSVLIDPGHGGEDPGANKYLTFFSKRFKKNRQVHVLEKRVALDVSKKIYKLLKKKKYRAYLTRSVDRTVSLQDRAAIAEKIQADLFISVHANSSRRIDPVGFETYYLDNHNDAAVKRVEELENRSLSGEELVVQKILTDLIIQKTVTSSKGLAKSIHSQIVRNVGKKYKLKDRGVKPALFYVLAMAKRPAILLEIGFLSNQKELRRLVDPEFQQRYAESVVRGIDLYVKNKLKKQPSLF